MSEYSLKDRQSINIYMTIKAKLRDIYLFYKFVGKIMKVHQFAYPCIWQGRMIYIKII